MDVNQVVTFDPRNTSFCFRMDANDCFYCKTGKCSLDLSPAERQLFKDQEGIKEDDSEARYDSFCENSVMYCHLLAADILTNGYRDPCSSISNYSCGHSSVGEGQHRACIGKRKKIQLSVKTEPRDYPILCGHCESMRSSLIYRVQSRFGKSYFFIG